MTTTKFNQSELSNYDGRPVTLYKFTRGTITYLYAESDRDVTIGFDTYRASNISDEGLALTGNATQDTFNVSMPTDTDLVQAYAGTAPSQTVTLTVLRYHPGDADAIVNYVGQVQSVSQKSPGMAAVSCVSLSGTFKRDGLRVAWERSCPYALFDMNCRVDKTKYPAAGLITSIFDGTVAFSSANLFSDGYFSGGFVEWPLNDETTERRGIQYHQGGNFQMFGLTDGLEVGMKLLAYPGCQRNTNDCINKFNNLINYGGIPMLPGKSPFDGSPVF